MSAMPAAEPQPRTCTVAGCNDRYWAKGLCARHYERKRSGHRHRSDQRIRLRARHQATARLLKAHPDEFEQLMAEELAAAETEAAQLQELAGDVDEVPVKLMPGPRPRSEPEVESRVRLDVAECPRCISYHDRGHTCPSCGRLPMVAQPVAQPGGLSAQEQAIEDMLRAGKSVQWITANTGEPAVLVRRALARLRAAT